MDPSALANEVGRYLLPFLPYLIKAGEKAAEEAGKKFGAAAWEKAQAIWAKLRANDEVKQAAKDAAAMPGDADARASLRLQLKKLLQADEALRGELAALWQETKQTVGSDIIQMIINVSGHGQVRDIIGKRIGGSEGT